MRLNKVEADRAIRKLVPMFCLGGPLDKATLGPIAIRQHTVYSPTLLGFEGVEYARIIFRMRGVDFVFFIPAWQVADPYFDLCMRELCEAYFAALPPEVSSYAGDSKPVDFVNPFYQCDWY